MRTRYVITHINKDGLRGLTFANQGRNHYDTREEAERMRTLVESDMRARGDNRADTLRAVPKECYDHGDAVGIYADHLDGDPCPHGHAWRVENGKPRIDCKEGACPFLYT